MQQITNFYVDWITENPKQLVYHDETLQMGIKCWNYIEYLPHLKEFAHFIIPLMGIVASEATRTIIELEKAKLFFALITTLII